MTKEYVQQDLMLLGKRYQNQKRSYLLIDPLQAKHLAVSPYKALEMMYTLGKQLYAQYPDTKCIIGFAETATAIAGAAASFFPPDTIYVQTTREALPDTHTVLQFSEEHSHAVEQLLDTSRMQLPERAPVLLIDDEISTGNTVANVVSAIRDAIPALRESPFTVGSVLNRMPEDRRAEANLEFSALLFLQQEDFEEKVSQWEVSPPETPVQKDKPYTTFSSPEMLKDPRHGLTVGELCENLAEFALSCFRLLKDRLHGRILVLGTEECMLPALFLGCTIERETDAEVYSHATTRSPIGISDAEGYPIRNGFRLQSFYEKDRTTYLYNIDDYDTVIVVTDSHNDDQVKAAMQEIVSLFPRSDCYLIRG